MSEGLGTVAHGRPRLVAVMGPTASGKTALAVSLAEALGGELVNADSRQAIRELAVGVCKPTSEELRGIPCHGLDWRHLGEPFTVAEFAARARSALEEIWARGNLPLVVGGSGLYVRSLLAGFDFGGVPPAEGGAQAEGDYDGALSPEASELTRISPDLASRVDLRNPRRVSRALQLARAGATPDRSDSGWVAVKVGCRVEPQELRRRIRERAQRILGFELRLELERLLAAGHARPQLAAAAIGYAEALAWMDGTCSWEQALERLELRSWRYARAQATWLRSEPELAWVEAGGSADKTLSGCLGLLEDHWNRELA